MSKTRHIDAQELHQELLNSWMNLHLTGELDEETGEPIWEAFLTDRAGVLLHQLATNLLTERKYNDLWQHKDDLLAYANLQICLYWKSADLRKTPRAIFNYITTINRNAFNRYMSRVESKWQRNTDLVHQMNEDAGIAHLLRDDTYVDTWD